MASSGTLQCVALVRTDISEEHIAFIIRLTRIGKLGTLAVHSVLQLLVTANTVRNSLILVTIMMEAIRSPETSVLTRAPWFNIPEDDILHSHHCENLKSYVIYFFLLEVNMSS
jgi:hypothetical protein